MSSIFIWKSPDESSESSKKTIKQYSGANWILEDNEHNSKSYKFLEQKVITDSDFDESVIIYNIKVMPQDWVGSELLEVSELPYILIKQDNYGILEQIGDWKRFTLKNTIQFTTDNLQKELGNIYKWIRLPSTDTCDTRNTNYNKSQEKKQSVYRKSYNNDSQIIDSTKIQNDFQNFLIKYSVPVSNITPTEKKNETKSIKK